MNIRLIVDSTADITAEYKERVIFVPLPFTLVKRNILMELILTILLFIKN